MSFTIKPINAFLAKDADFQKKMDPYVILSIGDKKYRSKVHKKGGKTPSWDDTFEVPLSDKLLMKVQVWDHDFIKDDFLAEGYYNLTQLINLPGNTQNQYIDLFKNGKNYGRILISMKYHPPSFSQNYGPNQYQQSYCYENPKIPFGTSVSLGSQNPNFEVPYGGSMSQNQELMKKPLEGAIKSPQEGQTKMSQGQQNIAPSGNYQNYPNYPK